MDATQKTQSVMDLVTNLLSQQFAIGDSFNMTTPSLSITLNKVRASNMNSTLDLNNGVFELPSYCNLISKIANSSDSNDASSPLSKYYNPKDENNCLNKVINIQVGLKSKA